MFILQNVNTHKFDYIEIYFIHVYVSTELIAYLFNPNFLPPYIIYFGPETITSFLFNLVLRANKK